MNVVLKILFFNFNNVKMNFIKLEIFSRTYILIEIILMIKKVKLVEKKKFKAILPDLKEENYIVYMAKLAFFYSQVYFFLTSLNKSIIIC